MTVLDLDPDVLDTTATIVEGYCRKQQEIMESYLRNTASLSYEWTDDKTLGTLLEEIKALRNRVAEVMNTICQIYPPYFKEKAEEIRRRPTM